MALLRTALVLLGAVVLQSTALGALRLLDGPPQLALVLVIAWSLAGGYEAAVLWGLLAGLLTDLASAAPFGASALAMSAGGILAVMIANSTFANSSFLPVIAALAGTLVYYGVQGLAMQLAGWSIPWLSTLTEVALPSAFLDALLIAPIYWLIMAFTRRQAVLGFK